jgi:hypothetical protein
MRHAAIKAETQKTGTTEAAAIYQIKITREDISPAIWRRVLVQAQMPLPALHRLIQTVMGWEDGHLHAFRVGKTLFGKPTQGENSSLKSETRVQLAQVAPAVGSKFYYEYDFGDDWQHLLVVEKVFPAEPDQTYPQCVAGERACPPEDYGGLWGYANLLAAISDPKHKDHEDMLDWLGDEFDPEAFDMDAVNAKLRKSRL